MNGRPTTVLTIGHSTRGTEEFLSLLLANHVTVLADVRTIPRSLHNPQFEEGSLKAALASAGIDYVRLPGLGGLRRPLRDSPNKGWRNASFRGFADYMLTEEFQKALAELVGLATARRTAIMCAEAVPWRCHRSLIADALTIRGMRVEHIIGSGPPRPHSLTKFAVVSEGRLLYSEEAGGAATASLSRTRGDD